IASLVNLADILYLQGRLFDSGNVCQAALKRFTGTLPDAYEWYWTLGRIAYQRNELGSSLECTHRAIELSAEAQEKTVHARALLQRALIQSALGKQKLAQADLDAADQVARGLQDQVVLRAVIRQRVLLALDEKELLAARQWLELLAGYGNQPFPFYLAYARGRVYLAEQHFGKAAAQFEAALDSLEESDYVLARLEALIWQAVCLGALGKITEAAHVLRRAVKAAQAEQIIRPFIEAREGLLQLTDRAERNGLEWVRAILDGKGRKAEDPVLTRREREILQLLSMGMSNQEMAEKLVIAEGTLKRHVANLYQKLGVHNRTQAVRYFHQQ
ncbi:MAG: LuxR C-terminal-related transcriptional regulator, partial [Chloroflexota bacterium]|nr:LuxR C-terminal-related transcriptional regulator [Chloroflexota bacterium]